MEEVCILSVCAPGGYVVNASSEEKRLAVNGMSYHDRAGENANSALIVTVNPEDFSHDIKGREEVHPLAGIHFQRELEEKAYEAGNGKIPVQLYGDLKTEKSQKNLAKFIRLLRRISICRPEKNPHKRTF